MLHLMTAFCNPQAIFHEILTDEAILLERERLELLSWKPLSHWKHVATVVCYSNALISTLSASFEHFSSSRLVRIQA